MLRRILPFVVLILLFVGLAVSARGFLTEDNLAALIRQTAVFNILALGMTLIIISSGIDLSVGSILAVAAVGGAMSMVSGLPVIPGIVVGILIGGLLGLGNGLLITRLKLSPFIVTLGTMGILRGAALLISDGMPIHNVPKEFSWLGEGFLLGLPVSLYLVAICAAVVHVILDRTRLGRYDFAIGSNVEAAIYAGIPVNFHLTMIYGISGLLAGLAGMIEASRLASAQPTAGQGYELQAIAAVVIGGGSLRGGEGSVVGTLIGGMIMGLLANGSDLLGIQPYWQQVLIGAAIILTVAVDEYLRKQRA